MEHIKIDKNDININSLEFGKKRCDCYLQVTDSCGTGASLERKQKNKKITMTVKPTQRVPKSTNPILWKRGKSIQFKCECYTIVGLI